MHDNSNYTAAICAKRNPAVFILTVLLVVDDYMVRVLEKQLRLCERIAGASADCLLLSVCSSQICTSIRLSRKK